MGPAPADARFGRRAAFLASLATAIVLGLASRRFGPELPAFVATYAGDALWAAAAYLALGVAWPSAPIMRRAIAAFALAVMVEASQIYHAPWIDGIRATRLGALLLGSGFLWSDLVCYAVGVAASAGGERLADRLIRA